ncbi:GNAT family N-acetyltransferase [Sulfitobacter sp. R18_1]|uniref:GNAT family N-acetyltransferase n=1 Tax=Sulfitobacter sp. R18_1 TaxID=2821104 RepID=UPI001ADADEF5|nr:GNAT family N-acetyltransferase [Sulfitobacter sp. R18_1]MBO9428670.1 GNAT family N-acetyltransferase [Sulfitobacter sp. R18_1]
MDIEIVPGTEVYQEEVKRQENIPYGEPGMGSDDPEFIQDRIKYLYMDYLRNETLVVARDEGRIVGAIGLQKNPYDGSVYWLKYVSVEEAYKNQGIASSMYEEAIKFVQNEGCQIERSSSSPDGRVYLTNVVSRLNERYPGVIKNPPEEEYSPPGAMI